MPTASATGRVSGGGIGSSPCSAFSARVAPTAKKPIGRIATISAWERSTSDVGRQRLRRQQAGDRRVERRVAGEEGAHPLARAFAGLGAEGGADREGAEQQAGPGDEDVVEDGGRELVAAEQRHGQRVAEVAGVDAEHAADHGADLEAGQPQDAARHPPGEQGPERGGDDPQRQADAVADVDAGWRRG